MTRIDAKTAHVVVLLLTVVAAMASATRFAASLALAGDGPQPNAKPPAVPTATGSAGQTAEVAAAPAETKALVGPSEIGVSSMPTVMKTPISGVWNKNGVGAIRSHWPELKQCNYEAR